MATTSPSRDIVMEVTFWRSSGDLLLTSCELPTDLPTRAEVEAVVCGVTEVTFDEVKEQRRDRYVVTGYWIVGGVAVKSTWLADERD